MIDGGRGNLIDVDEILAVKAANTSVSNAPAVDQNQGREVAQLQLRASCRVLIVVVGVAVARITASRKSGNGFA